MCFWKLMYIRIEVSTPCLLYRDMQPKKKKKNVLIHELQILSALSTFEPPCDKTKERLCAQRILRSDWASTVRMKKQWAVNYLLSMQWGLKSDWADDQADLSLR